MKVQYDKEISDPVWVSQAKFEDIFPSRSPDPSVPTPYAKSNQYETSQTRQPPNNVNSVDNPSQHLMRKEADIEKRKERAAQRQAAAAAMTSNPNIERQYENSSENIESQDNTNTSTVSRRQAKEEKRKHKSGKKERVFHATSTRGMMYDQPNQIISNTSTSTDPFEQVDINTSKPTAIDDGFINESSNSPNKIHHHETKRVSTGYDPRDKLGEYHGEQQEFFVPESFVFDAEHDALAKRLLELRNKRLAREKKMFEDWAKVEEG